MVRVYDVSANPGQAELGFTAWPNANSVAVPEYWTLLTLSAPIALEALLRTVLASWPSAAGTDQAIATTSSTRVTDFLSMVTNLRAALLCRRRVQPAPNSSSNRTQAWPRDHQCCESLSHLQEPF